MPVPKAWRKFYQGPEWHAIRVRILKRAGGRFNSEGLYLGGACCERCGRKGQRGRGRSLQIAHYPDPNPSNNDESNLQALCGRCHLRLDLPFHKANRSARKDHGRPLLAPLIDLSAPGLPPSPAAEAEASALLTLDAGASGSAEPVRANYPDDLEFCRAMQIWTAAQPPSYWKAFCLDSWFGEELLILEELEAAPAIAAAASAGSDRSEMRERRP